MLNTDETKVAANDSTKSDNKDGEMTYEQIQEIYTQTLRKHNRETETKVILNFLHVSTRSLITSFEIISYRNQCLKLRLLICRNNKVFKNQIFYSCYYAYGMSN